jgi:hypothetical protein
MAGIFWIEEANIWQSSTYHKMSKFIQQEYGRDSKDWRSEEMAVFHLPQNE